MDNITKGPNGVVSLSAIGEESVHRSSTVTIAINSLIIASFHLDSCTALSNVTGIVTASKLSFTASKFCS